MDARSRRRLRWIVACGTLLLTFALVEIGFRIYLFNFASQDRAARWLRLEDMPAHTLRYESHPYLCYALNPEFRSEDGLDRHNSLGLRGDETETQKPNGVVRIACVGGSSTYDTEIPDWRNAYPARLEHELRETHGRDDVEVLNCGVPGYNSWESLINLQFRILPLEPDLIIIYHATNDVHSRLVPPETYRADNTGFRHAWTEDLRWWDRSLFLHYVGVQAGFSQRNGLRDWVRVTRGRPPVEVRGGWLDANPPDHYRANLESMVAIAKHRGIDVVLTSWASCPDMDDYASDPAYRRGFSEMNVVSREVAERLGVPFFDLAAVMPRDPEYWDDGRHNNEKGARRKAELIAAFLEERDLP